MNNIYRRQGQVNEPPRFVRVDIPLVDFFVSDKKGYFEGVRFVEVGSEEWKQALEAFVRTLDGLEDSRRNNFRIKAEEQRSIVEGRDEELIHGSTNLSGIAYNLNLDGSPFRKFVSSRSLNLVCNVLPEDRRVDILPYREEGRPERRFYYDSAKAMGDGGRFFYEGDLRAALSEFRERGFRFSRARWATSLDIVRNGGDLVNRTYVLTENILTAEII